MKKFTASRITTGNSLFPEEVTISDKFVTIRKPAIFSEKERTISFNKIASVDVYCPLIGFSSIILETTGEDKIEISGFLKAEVKEMKNIILSML